MSIQLPELPGPPDFRPTQTDGWFCFHVFDEVGLIVDTILINTAGTQGASQRYGPLFVEQLEMAKDWMHQLKANPRKRAIAAEARLH